MSILIDSKTGVIVQGITGHHGAFHSARMIEYGSDVVAGVTPGRGGEKVEAAGGSVPVYDSVAKALSRHEADYSIIFVPAAHAIDAAMEALDSNLNIVLITEMMPVLDVLKIMWVAEKKHLVVIGPNCPGLISPGECKIGIMPAHFFKKGKVGVVSRSGTLTYEIVMQLSGVGIGQSSVVGVGGDMITGLNMVDCIKLFNKDPATEAIVVIGEIGGDAEEKLADYLKNNNISKPLVAYVSGKTAPKEKRMGHAGAIIYGKSGTYESKVGALKNAGVQVAELPVDVPKLISKLL